MSELTVCNYCKLQQMRRAAKKNGTRIVTKKSSFRPFGYAGVDAFEIPKGTKLPPYQPPCNKLSNGDKVYQKYHRAWFAELPDHCIC